ncbi:MAG: MGMT family protein [Methanobacteriota archaeon]
MDDCKVYELVKQIPSGSVSTYKEVAKAVGKPRSARPVGKILSKNPDLIKTPCHRVVHSDGRVGGYACGVSEKTRLLKSEGVRIENGRIVEFPKKLFKEFHAPNSGGTQYSR